jgi:uncharacterized phage protein (TIGR02218 family)
VSKEDINSLLLAHLKGEVTTLALCWKITKKNGDVILGTDHDLDIAVTIGDLAGVYLAGANVTGSDVASSSDMSVDNTEVDGSFTDNIVIPDLTVEDVRAGLLNNAPVTVFFTNWHAPDDGQCYMRSGFLGKLTWDSSSTYKTELRGLTQLLSQTIVQTYSVACDVVKFGDARCKVDVPAISITATVTAVTSRKEFTVSGITTQAVGRFNTGTLLGLTGANTGFTRQIKIDTTDTVQGKVTLFEPFPKDTQIGDTYTMAPGCPRSFAACKTFEDPADPSNPAGNIANFRGYGLLIPGVDAMMRGPVGSSAPVADPSGGGGLRIGF